MTAPKEVFTHSRALRGRRVLGAAFLLSLGGILLAQVPESEERELIRGSGVLVMRGWTPVPATDPNQRVLTSDAVVVLDESGDRAIQLAKTDTGSPFIALADTLDRVRAAIALDDDGVVLLRFFDETGRCRMELGTEAEGNPMLRMLDESGATVWKAP